MSTFDTGELSLPSVLFSTLPSATMQAAGCVGNTLGRSCCRVPSEQYFSIRLLPSLSGNTHWALSITWMYQSVMRPAS